MDGISGELSLLEKELEALKAVQVTAGEKMPMYSSVSNEYTLTFSNEFWKSRRIRYKLPEGYHYVMVDVYGAVRGESYGFTAETPRTDYSVWVEPQDGSGNIDIVFCYSQSIKDPIFGDGTAYFRLIVFADAQGSWQ